jgi:hypothetical protein
MMFLEEIFIKRYALREAPIFFAGIMFSRAPFCIARRRSPLTPLSLVGHQLSHRQHMPRDDQPLYFAYTSTDFFRCPDEAMTLDRDYLFRIHLRFDDIGHAADDANFHAICDIEIIKAGGTDDKVHALHFKRFELTQHG